MHALRIFSLLVLWIDLTCSGIDAQTSGARPSGQVPAISMSRVPPAAGDILMSLGDRLTTIGRERAILIGTIDSSRGPIAVTILTEYPGKLRIDEAQGRLVGYDGIENWSARGVLQDSDRDLLETLTSDTVEGFLQAIIQGSPGRLLGRRFRTDNGRTPNYSGPYYDIYELVVLPTARGDKENRVKRYYFDSRTGLLEKVVYSVIRGGRQVPLVVTFSGWKKTENQSVPGKIVRTENGTQVLAISIASVQFQPGNQNSIFGRPQ